ncbi:hypothetical protein SLEP1_g20079 [Rubroshorea leprosula]|uniref:Uncharacterized protein n=1 Tax=Rubroshorea leprosula TaxID=152421 RepID=A0AAV5JC11_9ROSI|nr:hypothetical protein SLEP1_g20079 [Rubroshorea leprosula]
MISWLFPYQKTEALSPARATRGRQREEDAEQIWNLWVKGESSRLETWFLSKKGGKIPRGLHRFSRGGKSMAGREAFGRRRAELHG